MKRSFLLIICFTLTALVSKGQAVPRGTELQELVKIAEVYANVPYLGFDLRYTFADSLTWTVHTDSMNATCKISYGRNLISNDDFEILSGSTYYVFVDKEDSLMIINRKTKSENIFQMPLLDSVFRAGHVSDMNITEINDSTWSYSVIFKPDSYYSLFEMRYNPLTGLIYYVNYHARNHSADYNIPEDHIVCVFIYMTNYSEDDPDPILFNENRYFYLLNGQMYVQPAWSGFEVVQ